MPGKSSYQTGRETGRAQSQRIYERRFVKALKTWLAPTASMLPYGVLIVRLQELYGPITEEELNANPT